MFEKNFDNFFGYNFRKKFFEKIINKIFEEKNRKNFLKKKSKMNLNTFLEIFFKKILK